MILPEPYAFKTLKLQNNSRTILAINRYIATDYAYIKQKDAVQLSGFTNSVMRLNPVFLYGMSATEQDIEPFAHPLVSAEGAWLAADFRSVVRLSADKQSYEVRNQSEYTLLMQRFILSGMWLVGKQSTLYGLGLAHTAYASWLSDNLVKRFGLDMNNQVQLRVLCLLYYAKLFKNDWSEDDVGKLAVRLQNDIVVPNLLHEVSSRITKLESIEDFCAACYEVTGNIRLKNLDFSVLTTVISNNWIGLNSKELITLALEHPPTWIAIVFAALSERSFKKNYITAIVEKHNKKGSGEEFLKSLVYMTRCYKEDSVC